MVPGHEQEGARPLQDRHRRHDQHGWRARHGYASGKLREFAPSVVASAYPIGTILGGIAGGLVAGWIAGRVGVKRLTVLTLCGMAAMIVTFGLLPPSLPLLLFHAALLGAMLFASACGCWLTIACAFPPQLRATGLGIASTMGRAGSIFGPLTAGYLLAAGFGVSGICLMLALPAILAALIFSTARRV